MSADAIIGCRGFFVIDALSPGALFWARKALVHLGNLLAMSLRRPPPLGVAVLLRNKATTSTQLQILLRPGRCFQLREYMAGVARLTAAEEPADGKTVGITIKALVEHMLTLGEGCTNHVFLLSSSFAPHATLQRVLQLVCSARIGAFLHFLQLSGPDADPAQNVPLQQQQRDDFMQCLAGLQHRATFEELTTDCEAVTDLLCHSWLRQLSTTGGCNASSSNPLVPDVLLQLGPAQASLPCKLQQHLLQLDPWLLPAQLCPCHMLPMQPPTGSATAALAAQSSASDAATAAALLALPEDPGCGWRCSITAQPVMQGCCATDAGVVQLGRHTQLRVAAQQGSSPLAAASGSLAGRAELPCSVALPLGQQPCELAVQHAVPLSRVDSSMMYGMPLVLVPAGAAPGRPAAASGTAGAAAAPCNSSQDASMLMRALCQLLLERGQVLLLAGCCDVVRRVRQPLRQWYVAQPAGDGASLLLRSIACREQLLPPVDVLQQLDAAERVLLLDAEQLDAVRSCLDSLPALGSGSSFSSSSSLPNVAAAAAAAGAGCGQPTAAASGDSAERKGSQAEQAGEVATGGQAATDREECADAAAANVPLPLLLSCGLHDWLAQVLAQSTGTYTPPASAPLAVPAPQQPPQQQAAAAAAQRPAGDGDASCHQQLPQPSGSGPAGGGSSVAASIAAAAFAGKAAAGGAAHAAKRQQNGTAGDGSRAGKAGAGSVVQQAAAGAAGTGGGKAGGRNALRLSSRRSGS